jgi:hypothetical protein
VVGYAKVDDEDYDTVAAHRWNFNGDKYPRTAFGWPQTWVTMHLFLVPRPAGMTVDHINGDKLDNRRANLRLCTDRQNNLNRPKQSNNKTGYKGVYVDGRSGKYVAQIRSGGTKHVLGSYAEAHLAYEAYCRACLALHGAYANVG